MRLFIGLILMIMFASCGKQESVNKDCHCGIIVNDGILYEQGENQYWFDIENSCSEKLKRVITSPEIWSETYNGDPICLEEE